jgi:NAD(P)-dependent dehydrogenase (short-subunit alcohol dehydrogenase family)
MLRSRKYALITGAGSGLGRGLAVHLAGGGWHVGIADVDSAGGLESQRLVEQAGGTAECIALDVRDESQWRIVRENLQQRWPQLDLLINNAGVCVSGEIGVTPIEDWDWVLAINVRGVILGCHTMVDWLKANPDRSYVLNVASLAGILSPPCMSAYSVSKAAVISLSESLYVEMKPHNVGVTVVCPWFVQTQLLERGRFAAPSHRSFAERRMLAARTSPERFAEHALRATFRNRLLATMGWRSSLLAWSRANFRQTSLDLGYRLFGRSESPSEDNAPAVPVEAGMP